MSQRPATRVPPSNCAQCPYGRDERRCRSAEGRAPAFCPTENLPKLAEACREVYRRPEVQRLALQSSIQEGEGYSGKELGYDRVTPCKPRLSETVELARRMSWVKLGLAYCGGLQREAAAVERFLVGHGFEVVSVVCKVGAMPKEELGVTDAQKIAPGTFEPMCNPVLQALVLNDARCELNILLGLCVGHDALFLKHAEAPCTVLAVKDRVLGHNPLAAVYQLDSYYRALKADKGAGKG